MENSSTPRVNARYLDSYVGRNVMLVGKVQQLRGEQAVMDAAGPVQLLLNRVRCANRFEVVRERRADGVV